MAASEVQKPLPQITPLNRPFWEAAARQTLVMQRCRDCLAYVWTPRPACFECGGARLDWLPLSGRGRIYSFTIIRQVAGRGSSAAFEKEIPYLVAWIDLDEGPRLLSNVVGCPVDSAGIGMEVSVVFEQVSAQIWLPKFTPA
jgi:uncharacterized OB-fold protein